MENPDPLVVAAIAASSIYKAIHACKAALLIYDYLITLDDEAQFMWRARPGITDALFFAARYSAWPETLVEVLFAFGDISSGTCKALSQYQSFSVIIGKMLSQGLIIRRTWAIWDRSRAVRALFAVLGAVSAGVGIYLNVIWASKTRFVSNHAELAGAHGCSIVMPYKLMYVGWLVFCCVDIALLGLTVAKYKREYFRPGSPRLTASLYRDAFLYFTLMLGFSSLNLLVGLLAPETYRMFLYSIERLIYTSLACRVIVNLRRFALLADTAFSIRRAETDRTLQFAHVEVHVPV